MSNVAEWPQALVRKPVVVPIFFLAAEPDPTKCVTWIVWRNLEAIMCINGLCIRVATSVSHPGSVARTKDRFNCRDQTTGRDGDFHLFVLSDVSVGFAIRDYEKVAAV